MLDLYWEMDSCLIPNENLEYSLQEKIYYLDCITDSTNVNKLGILLLKEEIYKSLIKLNWSDYSTLLNSTITDILYSNEFLKCEKHHKRIPYLLSHISGKNRYNIRINLLDYLSKYDTIKPYTLLVSATMYYELEEYEIAIIYYNKIIEEPFANKKYNIAGRLNDIGLCYQQLNDTTRAIEYFKKSIANSQQYMNELDPNDTINIQAYKLLINIAENNIREIQLDLNDENQTLIFFKQKQEQFKLRQTRNKGRFWEPHNYLLELAKLAFLAHSFDEFEGYISQLETYIKTRNFEQTIKFKLEYTELLLGYETRNNNSKQIESLTKQYNQLEEDYEFQKDQVRQHQYFLEREYILDLLSKNTNALEKEKQFKQSLILGVILLFILLFIFIVCFSKVKKTKKHTVKQKEDIERLLNDKKILLKEVHHRVKNNMQLIASFAKIDYRTEGSFDFDNFENRILSLSSVHNLLYQSEDLTYISLKTYLEELIDNISLSIEVNQLNYNINITDVKLNLEYGISIGLLINELIINTLKHCNNPHPCIKISFYNQQNIWYLRYKDNGKSLKKTSNQTFKELRLIKLLIDKIDGEYTVCQKSGFQITITFRNLTLWNK